MNKIMKKIRNLFVGLGRRLGVLFIGLIGIGIGVVLHWGLRPAQTGVTAQPVAAAAQTQPGHQVAYWTCAMHPQIHLPKPGQCPICGMKLIPVYKEAQNETAGMREFKTSPAAEALMNIETSPVERKFVAAEIRMVGKVAYDETRVDYITAWVPGRLDRLYVDYTGVQVAKGDHMVYMYSPELLSAQEELLQAIKAVQNIAASKSDVLREVTAKTVDAAREKLRLLGLTAEQVAEVEKRGSASDHLTIYAPISGIVVHKNALQGMYVNTGTRIYTVADLSHVWVKLDAYESDLSWLRYGQRVEFTTVSLPGEMFKGTISFIDPVLDPVTRTVKVRVDVPNPRGELKPEMFVKAVARADVAVGGRVMDPRLAGKWICPMHPSVIKDGPGKCDICGMPLVRTESLGYVSAEPNDADKPLVIPASAALVTGTRAIVYLQVPDANKPTFEGREVVLGPRAGDYYIVRHGLQVGQRVVTRGNFKIDSALQIEAKPSMMTPEGGGSGGMHMPGMSKSSDKKMTGPMSSPLPALSRSQMNDVVAASDVVFDAVKDLDISQINLAFSELGKSIKAVDPALLDGQLHAMWMESSMRLGNDAFEGAQVKTPDDVQRVANSLKTNISDLKSKFGLMAMPQTPSAAAAPQAQPKPRVKPINTEFKKQLGSVFNAYFEVQQALASDKFKESAAAAGAMNKALVGVDAKLLGDEKRSAWTKQAESIGNILTDTANAKDIEAQRQKFALLSEQMFAVGKQFGAPGTSALYQLKCPMALSGRGATWLQRDKATRNPYLGSKMPQCGSVIEVIKPANNKQ